MSGIMPGVMLTVVQYAEAVGVSDRTVKRWLKDNELPDATRDGRGRWLIPADAVRKINPSPVAAPAPSTDVDAPDMFDLSPQQVLDRLPGFVNLDAAAHLLGIPATAIRRNQDYFDVHPFGTNGALVMPLSRVKAIRG